MKTDIHFSSEGVYEYPVMSERERKMLVDYVIRACLGEVDIDYEMSGEWVTTPPEVIIRSRRKSNRAVKRALQKLFTMGWVTAYTVKPNGYIHVDWFNGYIKTSRQPAVHKIAIEGNDVMPLPERYQQADYIRDRIFLSSNNFRRDLKNDNKGTNAQSSAHHEE